MQLLRKPPFPIKRQIRSPKQRRHLQPINYHPQRHVISSRGRTWIIIFKYQNSSPHAQDARRDGPSATTNAHTDGKKQQTASSIIKSSSRPPNQFTCNFNGSYAGIAKVNSVTFGVQDILASLIIGKSTIPVTIANILVQPLSYK